MPTETIIVIACVLAVFGFFATATIISDLSGKEH